MSNWGPVTISFAVGALFSWFELCTSKYPNTSFLIAFKRPVLIYCIIYGIIASGVFLLAGSLIADGKLTIEGIGLSAQHPHPYIVAVLLGLSCKAIMQLNLYTVTVGATPWPIGFQTVIQLFEPYLIRAILITEFDEVRNFVKPYADRFPVSNGNLASLDTVKQMIKDNIPESLSNEERAGFENDIGKYQQVWEAMERFLRFLGPGTFRRVFK